MMKCKSCGHESENGVHSCEGFKLETAKANINDVLKERGGRYGKFSEHAKICQDLKGVMLDTPSWKELSNSQKQSLEVIADKIARMLNGDPNYKDNWVDIIGYSQLILDELEENPWQRGIVFDDDGTTD